MCLARLKACNRHKQENQQVATRVDREHRRYFVCHVDKMNIRKITSTGGMLLREIRLRALAYSAHAFEVKTI